MLVIWLCSGAISWFLTVFFVGYVIGYGEFKKPLVRPVGVAVLAIMTAMGFFSLVIALTAAIPFLESLSERQNFNQEGMH